MIFQVFCRSFEGFFLGCSVLVFLSFFWFYRGVSRVFQGVFVQVVIGLLRFFYRNFCYFLLSLLFFFQSFFIIINLLYFFFGGGAGFF